MGGIAIAGALALTGLALGPLLEPGHWLLLGAALTMFVVGLVDDHIQLKPHTKLLAQVVVAAGLAHLALPDGAGLGLPAPVEQLLGIFFLVLIANAFNLLDNMDGLCAGVAAIAGGFLVILHAADGRLGSAALAAAMTGSVLGFLRYNTAPARIFMGDCGSLMIGIFFGGSAILDAGTGSGGNVVSVVALPVLILMIPLMDTTLVTVSRRLAGRPISQGGCDHSSHRLVAIGLSEKHAVLFLYALAFAGGLTALAVRWLDWYVGQVFLPVFVLVIGLVGGYLGQVRVYHDRADGPRTALPLLAQHKYRRRMAEVLIDTGSVAVGYYLAHLLRFEDMMASPHIVAILKHTFPLVIVAHLLAYWVTGVYRGIWRHTSVSDLPRFARAVGVGLLFTLLAVGLQGSLLAMSKAVLALNLMLQLLLLLGTRASFKLLGDLVARSAAPTGRSRVLVVGMSQQSDLALRQMRTDPSWGLEPAGLICEEQAAVGLEIQGTPVLGTSQDIRDVLRDLEGISSAVLIDEAYQPECWERIRRVCAELGVPTRVVKFSLQEEEPVPAL